MNRDLHTTRLVRVKVEYKWFFFSQAVYCCFGCIYRTAALTLRCFKLRARQVKLIIQNVICKMHI